MANKIYFAKIYVTWLLGGNFGQHKFLTTQINYRENTVHY